MIEEGVVIPTDTGLTVLSLIFEDRFLCFQVFDMSYGAIESIDQELFKNYPNLRVLNVSHNSLGLSGHNLNGTFTHLTLIREVGTSFRCFRFKPDVTFILRVSELRVRRLAYMHINHKQVSTVHNCSL